MRVTAELAANFSTAPIEAVVDGERVYWTDTGARTTLQSWSPDRGHQRLAGDRDVRSRVHGYGGGAVTAAGGELFYVDDLDQRLYRRDTDGQLIALTPENPRDRVFYGDLYWDERRSRILCVEERHHDDGRVDNHLVAVADDGSGVIRPLVERFDFVAGHKLDAAGERLTWISWSLPDMPWDQTALWVADLDGDGLGEARCIASGASIVDPQWGDDGTLYFVSDAPGYWMLHAWDGAAIRLVATTHDLSVPQLRLNYPRYAVIDNDLVVAAETVAARTRLIRIDLRTGDVDPIALPFAEIHSVRRMGQGSVCFVGLAEDAPPAIVRLDARSGEWTILHRPAAPALAIIMPQDVVISRADGGMIHAFHYQAERGDGPAPLIVMAHGGPMNHANPSLSLVTQYWLDNGFSCLDVNYRGSSGYGRAYRHELRGHWGEYDWQDLVSAAEFAVAQGWADPAKLIVRGSSAGGFTALCAMTRARLFSAGASHFGVADPAQLLRETHKFESEYLKSLIGPWPEAQDLYRARAPIHNVDGVNAPLIFFQGTADPVVPQEQTAQMVDRLQQKGLTVEAHYYPGEGHGFRDPAVRMAALQAERAFYCKVLSID